MKSTYEFVLEIGRQLQADLPDIKAVLVQDDLSRENATRFYETLNRQLDTVTELLERLEEEDASDDQFAMANSLADLLDDLSCGFLHRANNG